jgi:hypothetical protein
MKTVIEVEHLRKTYGSLVAVDDVSFAVSEGEIFGLLGPQWRREDHDRGVRAGPAPLRFRPDSGARA